MKTNVKPILLLALTVLALSVIPTATGEEIHWIGNLRHIEAAAKRTNRPVVLHFYAEWCGPCKKLDRDVFTNKQLVKTMNEDVIAAKVDVDKYPGIAEQFNVTAIPADVYLSPEGDLLSAHASPATAGDYLARIKMQKRAAATTQHAERNPQYVREAMPSTIRQPLAGGRWTD